ncbi:A-kinase anchor protein 12b isoform 1-T1 [Pholidichthys leucotaenia]
MGAQSSVQRDGRSQEDAPASAASAGDLSAEVKVLQEGGGDLDSKSLQKNGQISSMTSLNGHSEDNTLAEVGQPDGVSVGQKEEAPETMDAIQDEVPPQVNGEKADKETPDPNEISAVEEKEAEEKSADASEVGFKKIFRFVGFKFTLKKDKSEEKDPVKLLTVKDKEDEEVSGTDEPAKKEEETEAATAEEKSTAEEKQAEPAASTAEAEVLEKAETTDAPAETTTADATDAVVKEDGAEKEDVAEKESPPAQESALSPFRKFFSGGLFSNLRKKASIKKSKEEEEDKEVPTEEETAKTEETAVEEKEEKSEVEQEKKEEKSETNAEEKSPKEEAVTAPDEAKSEENTEAEITAEAPVTTEATTDEFKQKEKKTEVSAEEEEKAAAEVTSEAELLSPQEKAKPQGSPLKKLFTGAGLKKLSTKKKNKKDLESKLTESGEQATENLQSSTESAEAVKPDSGPSSPEESGEHVLAVEVTQNESSQETDSEAVSDGEKKKEGIIAWSSFKKLVTPKKRVKRSSESDDEATSEKPAKSATLSSSESAALADKSVEEEETKEDKPSEEEPKTENTEKLVSSTEEPKKKMDTSVSWEALMCMGGTKKRTRKTSDSDDEETKIEEEVSAAPADGDQEAKAEAAIAAPQNTESEGEVVSSPEPLTSPPERESTWDTLKRIVMSKSKPKVEEKPEEPIDQAQSDGEAPKEESSFSLRKFFPGRRKKKAEKQASTDHGSGEEDSETPAVVPLSEYEEKVEAKPEPEAPAEPAAVQIKVSAEDRAPSWIPAGIEDVDEKHDQLSDIPEEAENAATPKSVDTDITEDETEDQAALPKAPVSSGHRLSTSEVKPIDPPPAVATTLIPQGPMADNAEEVKEGIQDQISEIPSVTSVTAQDVPAEVASETTEPEPPTDNAKSVTNTILELHSHEEAMAICTGLGTKEIAKVALEKTAQPIVECVTVIRDALSSEVSVEEKPLATEEATISKDLVFNVHLEQAESVELEPTVVNAESEVSDVHAASASCEPEIEKVGVVSTVVEESEVSQPTTIGENSPKAEFVNHITSTSESAICTQSVKVSEVTVETKEVKVDIQQLPATEEINLVIERQVATEEKSPDICETAVPVVVQSEEVPVISDTAVLVAPLSGESDQVTATENASESKPNQQQETKEFVETTEATPESAISPEEVPQNSEIETQSIVITQAVIQDAVDKVSEDAPEPKKPSTPTSAIPTPVQAVATTEKWIDISTESPVITDTSAVVVCEKPVTQSPQPISVAMEVINAIPVVVTEELKEESQKPEECLKQAVEVQVSEENAVVEEVEEEIEKMEETREESEQAKKEQSKDQEPEVKVAEEVESKSAENMSEDPSENTKKKEPELHMPVQVVLQTAQVVQAPSIEDEAVEEFDNSCPAATGSSAAPEGSANGSNLPVVQEESQDSSSAEVTVEAAASQSETEKTASKKCAEVMAQVIEVIEEAVKEIEPVSTEITAAS